MHEVSLRSSVNLMDAHNLAIVLCPNLVSSPSPARDIAMCAVPSGPSLHPSIPTTSNPQPEGRTTLGAIIKLCIQRYYEVFDEVEDLLEARYPRGEVDQPGTPSSTSSSFGARPAPRRQSVLSKASSSGTRDSRALDDDESIDDAMLVMPIGLAGGGPPSTWSTVGPGAFRPRHRTGLSGGGSRSMHTTAGGTSNPGTVRARATASVVEGPTGTARGKGSIAVGRGTTRKSTGSAVQAVGVTASGFFTPPDGSPPLPDRAM